MKAKELIAQIKDAGMDDFEIVFLAPTGERYPFGQLVRMDFGRKQLVLTSED